MLLLIRRPGESVFLHDKRTKELVGEVKIIAANSGQVRIGFECPPHISIERDDIKNRREEV
jgi:carbon storage regulator CsrA